MLKCSEDLSIADLSCPQQKRIGFSGMLRARRNEKEMKVKPATSFKLLTIFIHKKIRQDSKQKNVSKE